MCVPVLYSDIERLARFEKVRAARKIVKKYKRREEKREIQKLRKLLPHGDRLKNREVIDETVNLIVDLEQKLLRKMSSQGWIPSILSNTGLQQSQLSLDSLREAMALVVPRGPGQI